MLRFLFGGLATVAGLVLLFVASFGDPALVLNRFDSIWSMFTPGRAPVVSAANAPASPASGANNVSADSAANAPAGAAASAPAGVAANAPAGAADVATAGTQQHAFPVVPPSQPPSASRSQMQADQAPSVQSPPSADQTAAMRAQRQALEQQLRHLQGEMAQASQSVTSLHSQADAERHDLEALQQQRDALQRQREAAEAQERQLDAKRERAATAAAAAAVQASKSPAAEPGPAAIAANTPAPPPVAATPPAPTAVAPHPPAGNPLASGAQPQPQQSASVAASPAPAQIAQADETADSLPLPPPLPVNPPPVAAVQQSPQTGAASPATSQVAARADAVNAGRLAVDGRAQERSQRVVQSDPGVIDTVLNRLRHAPPSAAPPSAAPPPPPGPEMVARAQDAPAAPPYADPTATYSQPRQVGPRARLGMARAALAAGRIDVARQYLEEAQLQLVFRPVTPGVDSAPGESRVAGDVASALSMLGSGDTGGALQYVDRAMGEARAGGYPPPRGDVYGGLYGGGAPVAEAGH